MKKRFEEHRDGHDEHDYIVYRAHEKTLMHRFNKYKNIVQKKIEELLPDLDLTGQWSIDVMMNGNDFWLIDMALANLSYGYSQSVKLEDRKIQEEDWIPRLK